jgi:hypothetical protein
MKVKRMAVAWMRKEDWPRWLEIDPQFQPDYDHWLRRMEAAYADLLAKGVNAVKVEVLPEKFLAWLESDAGSKFRALPPTQQRAGYAAMKARNMDVH